MQEPIKCDSICGHDNVEKACKSGTCMCGRQIHGCGFMHRLSLYSPCTMYTYDVQPVERLIVLERAALQLDILANEVVVHVHTPRWISGLHGLGSVISSSTRVYRLSSSPHVPSSRCTGRSSLQQKHGHCVVHACRIYSWTKTNYRRCARYVYLHSAPFRLLMMQHNSYVSSSSSIITVMPHDCMAFSYFIRLSVGQWCSLRWTAFSYAYDIHIYMTAAQVKHNGDHSPDVPRDAYLLLYTLRCISTCIVVAW